MDTINKRSISIAILSIPLFFAVVEQANAATITWSAPIAVSGAGDSIIDTTNSLVEAINFGTTIDQIINGVLFDGQAIGTNSANSNFSVFNRSAIFSGFYTDGGIGVGFEALMDSFSWRIELGQANVTFDNLTVGNNYSLQVLVSDDRTGGVANDSQEYCTGLVCSQHPLYSMGYSLTGSFVADTTSQLMTIVPYNGNTRDAERLRISGYQLRVATAVSEPATFSLFGLGLLGLAAARRRKKA